MNQNKDHIDTKPLLPKHEELFTKMDVPFEKSKAEMWDALSNKIDLDKSQTHKGKQVFIAWQRWAAIAAVLVIAITSGFVLQRTTVTSLAGEQLAHTLPDGSKVFLNAGSEISYKPNLWNFQREVMLSGEAFFEVEKGKRFTVISDIGTTEVLGTSFNIYARKAEYEVFCKTGKVKVSNQNKQSEIIVPGEKVGLGENNNLIKKEGVSENEILFWREGKLKFVSRKLPLVLEELERQYNTTIHVKGNGFDQITYTGYFNRDKKIDSVLEMMALSLNLKLEKIEDQEFILE